MRFLTKMVSGFALVALTAVVSLSLSSLPAWAASSGTTTSTSSMQMGTGSSNGYSSTASSSSELSLAAALTKAGSDQLTLSVSPTAQAASNPAIVKSLAGQVVTFYVKTKVFSGDGMMAVGTATTNASGVATLNYMPTWTGVTDFAAQMGATSTMPAMSTSLNYNVLKDPTGVPSQYFESQRPLHGIATVLVKFLIGIAAAVWLILLGTLAVVLFRMPRLGRSQ